MNYFRDLIKLYFAFFRIGAFTFGGGYAMLPMLEKELVDKYKWVTLEEIMDYFAIGQCTPGVIAVNTATFIGYKRRGIIGGIVATLGVITPSIIVISLIATILAAIYENQVVKYAFSGIGVAVCAVLIQAVIKMGKSGIKDIFTLIVAALAFFLSFVFDISTILIIAVSAVAAIIYRKIKRSKDSGGTK